MAHVQYQLRLNSSAIRRLSESGGIVDRYIESLADQVLTLAADTAPGRSGVLKSSHVKIATMNLRGDSVWKVRNTAPYARFVHRGTAEEGTGYIHPTDHEFLRFVGEDGQLYYRRQVRGQKPQPWLRDALREVMRGVGHGVRRF